MLKLPGNWESFPEDIINPKEQEMNIFCLQINA
jgi:hypothetical protein